jgi:hypothetical protein
MEDNTYIKCKYMILLTEDDANWLMGIVQNELIPEESEDLTRMRKLLWYALYDQGVRPI